MELLIGYKKSIAAHVCYGDSLVLVEDGKITDLFRVRKADVIDGKVVIVSYDEDRSSMILETTDSVNLVNRVLVA